MKILKKWLIAIGCVGAVTTGIILTTNESVTIPDTPTTGNVHYFSNSGSSTASGSKSDPFKFSSAKLNSSIASGYSVLLKRDETFYGNILIKKSGITIGAYDGSGEKPIITSLVKMENWVAKGNGVYESYNPSLGSTLNLVLINGVQQNIGRYPNTDDPNRGYLNFESHSGTTSIRDDQLGASGNYWQGAELVVRVRRWILDRSKIISHTSNTITYSPKMTYEPYNKMGYFIQNSLKTLDRFGEWYYNPSTKKLSVYFGSGNPASYNVQAPTAKNLLYSENYSNVKIDNISFRGANEDGIEIKGGEGFSFTNVDVNFSGKTGIIINSHDKLKIENSTVNNSNHKGLDLGFLSHSAQVRNNKITNTGMIAGMTGNFDGSGIGLYGFGNNSIYEFNEIKNSGYSGMYFNGSDVVVKNNVIDSFCLVKDDGAGIYTHKGSTAFVRRKVQGNIITNGLGAGPGTDNPSYFPASGVYLDNGSSPTDILNNTIYNCNKDGIFIHNSAGSKIIGNTIYNNPKQISMVEDEDGVQIRNFVITGNILFSKNADQFATWLKSASDAISSFGRWDSNVYARPIDDRVSIYTQIPGSILKLDLNGWRNKYNEDEFSKITSRQIKEYKLQTLIGGNKFANGLFSSNVVGVATSSANVSHSSGGLLDGGYLQVSPTQSKSSINVKVGELKAGKKYLLKFSVRGSFENNMVMGTYLRQGSSPYGALTPQQYRKVSMSRTENDMIFLATKNEANAVAVFSVDKQSRYYLDNIQLVEADATITDVNDSLRFEFNPTSTVKTLTLGGIFQDATGTEFKNTIVLQPYASAVLLRTGNVTPPIDTIPTDTIPTDTIPGPTISLTSSATTYNAPATIKLTAVVVDSTTSEVEFIRSTGSHLYSRMIKPWTCEVRNVARGTYSFSAIVTDKKGATTKSNSVTVIVQ